MIESLALPSCSFYNVSKSLMLYNSGECDKFHPCHLHHNNKCKNSGYTLLKSTLNLVNVPLNSSNKMSYTSFYKVLSSKNVTSVTFCCNA